MLVSELSQIVTKLKIKASFYCIERSFIVKYNFRKQFFRKIINNQGVNNYVSKSCY